MPRISRRVVLALCIACNWSALPASAQWQSNTGPNGASLGAVVGGDVERYVRALVLAGRVRSMPWGARPLDANDLSVMLQDSSAKPHPWAAALTRALKPKASVGAMLFAGANSGFPWGSNDGALWQGRGVNAAAGLALSWRWWRVTAVAAPLAFIAQNATFPLMPQPSDVSPFAAALFPHNIDLPQRYGTGAYARLDGGESSISVRGMGLVAGVSTASQGWGPGESFPAILGPNAGGFPHLFVGTTARGTNIPGIGHISARYLLGLLQQSAYSPVHGSTTYVAGSESGTERIGVGLTLSFQPAVVPDLEFGTSRFYHSPYRSGPTKWSPWSKPFEGLFKRGFTGRNGPSGDQNGDFDNQLASAFVRWTFPVRGAEATFEYFREDHSWDSRDLSEEPESNAAVIASVRAATSHDADRLSVLTLEYFDGDIPTIAQVRGQGGLYIHGTLLQGHTQRGQLLGTPIGAGAIAGESVSWESFSRTGSMRINLRRWRPRSLGSRDSQGLYFGASTPVPNNHDWTIDGSVGITRYRQRNALSLDAGLAWAGLWELRESRTNLYVRTSIGLF